MRLAASILAAVAVANTATAETWSASADGFQLGLKTLVVGSGKSTEIPGLVLEAYNTAWDKSATVPSLSSPDYQAIVITDSVSGDALSKLRGYCAKYGARLVFLNAKPSYCGGNAGSGSGSNVVFDTSADPSITGILNTNNGWSVPSGASPASPAGVKPLMRFSSGSGKSSSGGVAAFTNTVDGCESMCFTFDAAKHSLNRDTKRNLIVDFADNRHAETNLAVGHMWFPWATHGIFIGQRRMLLGMQIDDWFIASGQWKPHGEGKEIRIGGSDCRTMISNTNTLNGMFPSGSKIKFEPAINGVGMAQNNWESWNKLGQGLNECSRSNQDKFYWVSHTWTHQHLDWLNGDDCNRGGENTCPTPYTRLNCEMAYNIELMKGQEVNPNQCFPGEAKTPAGIFKLNPANWSPHSLVTPEISGIVPAGTSTKTPKRVYGRPGNHEATRAMKANGISTVTGDNSREELKAKNPYHGLYLDGVLIIPRHAPSMAYNCDTPDCYVRNWKSDGACNYTPGPSCSGFNLNFQNAITRDVRQFVPYMLMLRADPYMFHQANAAATVNGGSWSITSWWAKTMAEELGKYINKFPVVSKKMDDMGDFFRARMSRDSCGIKGSVTISGGKPSQVSVSGSGCTALVSFTQPSGASPSGVATETYGSDVTAKVSGSKTFAV